MKKLILGALLLAAAPALAQTPQQDQTPVGKAQAGQTAAATQKSDQAKKDVDVAGIHLQVARLYVTGLYRLADKPTAWDREHGVALFNQAQNAVTDAERQLAELQGAAQGSWANANEPLARARKTLAQVQGQLRSLSVPLRTGGGQDQAGQSIVGQMYKSIGSAQQDLESAAKAMGVDTKLRTP
jgi:hypothetical protein